MPVIFWTMDKFKLAVINKMRFELYKKASKEKI